jgi:hypothetical protein
MGIQPAAILKSVKSSGSPCSTIMSTGALSKGAGGSSHSQGGYSLGQQCKQNGGTTTSTTNAGKQQHFVALFDYGQFGGINEIFNQIQMPERRMI